MKFPLSFSSLKDTKQLREQIAQLTTNQIPPDVSPDDIAALQDRKKEGYTVKKMSYGYKITEPKKDVTHRRAKDVTDVVPSKKKSNAKTTLYAPNDGRGDFSDTKLTLIEKYHNNYYP